MELLTLEKLIAEAKEFCQKRSQEYEKDLYGVTDGKAIGTFIEHKFQNLLKEKYKFEIGSSAKGIDFPSEKINTDIKVTLVKQPQSSCPFRSARQKIYGLGYNILLFVYDKEDIIDLEAAKLTFVDCSFISKERTADYRITYRLRQMLEDGANKEDIIAYLIDMNLPADDIVLDSLADEILKNPPKQGYLSISNALQWRLQYSRIVGMDQSIDGIIKIYKTKANV